MNKEALNIVPHQISFYSHTTNIHFLFYHKLGNFADWAAVDCIKMFILEERIDVAADQTPSE